MDYDFILFQICILFYALVRVRVDTRLANDLIAGVCCEN